MLKRGRIIKSIGGFYDVDTGEEIVTTKPRGVMRHRAVSPLVGDIAVIDTSGQWPVITEIEPRQTVLARPPVANLEVLAIVVSTADPAPNLRVIDRQIITAEAAGILPVVVITKCDLAPGKELSEIYQRAGFQTICSSADPNGPETARLAALLQDKISAFSGNSGAGKSTLLNLLVPEAAAETGDISKKLGRGRHTTRHTQLYKLPRGGYLADTPGFSSLDLEGTVPIRKEELPYLFREMRPFLGKCPFADCSHTKERVCAVRKAVEAGAIPRERYESYLEFYESARQLKEWEISPRKK